MTLAEVSVGAVTGGEHTISPLLRSFVGALLISFLLPPNQEQGLRTDEDGRGEATRPFLLALLSSLSLPLSVSLF